MIFYLSFSLLFFFSFLLPNHYSPWMSFYLEFSAFSSLFIFSLYIAFLGFALRLNKFFILLLVYSALPILQYFFFEGWFFGDALLLMFFLVAFSSSVIFSYSVNLNSSEDRLSEYIAGLLVFVGAVSVWLSMIQWFGLWVSIWVHDVPFGARPNGNLAQPNNYSSLIWLSLFSLYYLYERKRIGAFGLIFAGLFLIGGAALAQSRTSWVVLGVLVVVAVIHWAIFRRWRWQRLALPLAATVAFYVLGFLLIGLKGFLFGEGGQGLRTGFTDIRTDMWMAFIHAILERPWFGYGWGQVSLAQLAVAEMYPAVGLTQYSHNLFLDLLIWNGIPLGLVFIALICFFWLRIFFVASSAKGFYSLCCFSVLLVHSLLEYPHAYSYFLLLAGFFIGISVCDPINTNTFRFAGKRWLSFVSLLNVAVAKTVRVPRVALYVVVVLFAAALVISWLDYRKLEEDHRLLRFEVASIGTLKAEQKAPDVIFFDQLQSFTWLARTKQFEDLTADEQERVEKVAARYALPMPLFKLAQLRLAQNRPEEAEQTLKTIKHLHGEDTYNAAVAEFRALTAETYGGEESLSR